MSEQQVIDRGASHKYRTEIPNIIARNDCEAYSELSVHAKWLYVFLKSTAGDTGKCWRSTKSIAEGSGLSTGAVSKGKRQLEEAGLIVLEKGDQKKHQTDTIWIVDIWLENMLFYSDDPSHSSDEHPIHEMNTPRSSDEHPVHEVKRKKNPVKKNTKVKNRDSLSTRTREKLSDEQIQKADEGISEFGGPSLEQCIQWGRKIMLPAEDCEAFWLHYEARGWEIKGSEVHNPYLLLKRWKQHRRRFKKKDEKEDRAKRWEQLWINGTLEQRTAWMEQQSAWKRGSNVEKDRIMDEIEAVATNGQLTE